MTVVKIETNLIKASFIRSIRRRSRAFAAWADILQIFNYEEQMLNVRQKNLISLTQCKC